MTSPSGHVRPVDVRAAALPPCARCGCPDALTVRYPHSWRNRNGADVTGFKETVLCPVCEANDPATTKLLTLLRRIGHRDAEHRTALDALAHEWLDGIGHRGPDPAALDAEEARWRAGDL
ncbi:DUF6300 family protein [Streptomyces sp. MST-110588]|uniref:DUF6300 family protein n=1 Tax=Streptomyces sp. MST-110588 TaxID=2833628 RepID=UPI001F5E24A1|nr:DUF6300 family protein [Streptomyces sp. MST-110588]UNO38561.1 hypothetical protein KGS77_01495 [Streptomyces sp. MST-110588]